jgi:hypothetical protein
MLVRGTQAEKPLALEFQKDTVYERKNIKKVEPAEDNEIEASPHQHGTMWEYEETQYTYPEYVQKQQTDSGSVKLAIAELAEIIGG